MQAVRQGQWVLLDEINLAPLEVLESLNCILDDTGFIVVESGYVAIFLTLLSIYQYCTLVISVASQNSNTWKNDDFRLHWCKIRELTLMVMYLCIL